MKNILCLFIITTLVINQACQPTSLVNSTKGIQSIDTSKENIPNLDNAIIINNFYNNSFEEDNAVVNKSPTGWKNCGDLEEVNVDIHNNIDTLFDVVQSTNNGNNYIGLRTSYNDTWGVISQKLERELQIDSSYLFHLEACRSTRYINKGREGEEDLNEESIRIRIWGGDNDCNRKELLAESDLVKHTNWKTYIIKMKPKENHSSIFIDVFFKKEAIFPYNGNILIDKISPIYLLPQ